MDGFLERLAARRRFGMKPGLETIRALLSELGSPERRVRAIHVAGTNGKGAFAAIVDSVLRAAGKLMGRYTSPHLVRLNERFSWTAVPYATRRSPVTRRWFRKRSKATRGFRN